MGVGREVRECADEGWRPRSWQGQGKRPNADCRRRTGAWEGGAIFTLPKSVIGVSSVLQPTHRNVSGVVVAGDSSTLLYASKKMLAILFAPLTSGCGSATVLYSKVGRPMSMSMSMCPCPCMCVCMCVQCWQPSGALISMYGSFVSLLIYAKSSPSRDLSHPPPGQPPRSAASTATTS